MASNATLSTQACTSRARARPATRPHQNRQQSSRSPCPSPAARATRRRPGRPWSRRRSRAEPRARRARASACRRCTRSQPTRGRRRPSIRATATGGAGAYLKPSRRRAGRRRRRTSRTRRPRRGRERTCARMASPMGNCRATSGRRRPRLTLSGFTFAAFLRTAASHRPNRTGFSRPSSSAV